MLFIFILGLIAVFLLRHFFGMKYPMLQSKSIISLPAIHIFLLIANISLVFYPFTFAMYMLNHDPEGMFSTIIILLTLIGTLFIVPISIIMSITLLYRTFNFGQYKENQLFNTFNNLNWMLTSLLVLSVNFAFILLSEIGDNELFMIAIFFSIIGIGCSVYLFTEKENYRKSLKNIYSHEYNSSIQSVIVKGIQTTIPQEIRSTRQAIVETKLNVEKTKRCPYCGEEILAVAKKCRYCGEWLTEKDNSSENQSTIHTSVDTEHESKTVVLPEVKEEIHAEEKSTIQKTLTSSAYTTDTKPIVTGTAPASLSKETVVTSKKANDSSSTFYIVLAVILGLITLFIIYTGGKKEQGNSDMPSNNYNSDYGTTYSSSESSDDYLDTYVTDSMVTDDSYEEW